MNRNSMKIQTWMTIAAGLDYQYDPIASSPARVVTDGFGKPLLLRGSDS